MHYLLLYMILGVCIAVLAFAGYQLYRQYSTGARHRGSLRRSRKSHRHDP